MYKKPPGIRCVFLIGMHSPGEKVKILNFRRPYKPDVRNLSVIISYLFLSTRLRLLYLYSILD